MKTTTTAAHPFFPYMGGKRKIANWIHSNSPETFRDYYEPFLGGGAIALDVLTREAKGSGRKFYLSDFNPEIVAAWSALKETPDLLFSILEGFFAAHCREHFNAVRFWDRNAVLEQKSQAERGARWIYLARTCFGGSLTTDKSGFMKASYAYRHAGHAGHAGHSDPDYANMRAVSELMNAFDVTITQGSYERVLNTAGFGDFIYLDPPYETTADDGHEITSNYVSGGFDHGVLAENLNKMTALGAMVLMSNADTAPVRNLFAGFACVRPDHIWTVNGARRDASEILVSNWRLADRLTKQRALVTAA